MCKDIESLGSYLCREPCKAGSKYVAGLCIGTKSENCEPGWRAKDGFCVREQEKNPGIIWNEYPNICPDGYSFMGLDCQKNDCDDDDIEAQGSFGALCKRKCKPGFDDTGVGCVTNNRSNWKNIPIPNREECDIGYYYDNVSTCWVTKTYNRGVGIPPTKCEDSKLVGITCWDYCREGDYDKGATCEKCPAGYNNNGFSLCYKPCIDGYTYDGTKGCNYKYSTVGAGTIPNKCEPGFRYQGSVCVKRPTNDLEERRKYGIDTLINPLYPGQWAADENYELRDGDILNYWLKAENISYAQNDVGVVPDYKQATCRNEDRTDIKIPDHSKPLCILNGGVCKTSVETPLCKICQGGISIPGACKYCDKANVIPATSSFKTASIPSLGVFPGFKGYDIPSYGPWYFGGFNCDVCGRLPSIDLPGANCEKCGKWPACTSCDEVVVASVCSNPQCEAGAKKLGFIWPAITCATCRENRNLNGLLCYKNCNPGYRNVAGVCWNERPLSLPIPESAKSKSKCEDDRENVSGLCYKKCGETERRNPVAPTECMGPRGMIYMTDTDVVKPYSKGSHEADCEDHREKQLSLCYIKCQNLDECKNNGYCECYSTLKGSPMTCAPSKGISYNPPVSKNPCPEGYHYDGNSACVNYYIPRTYPKKRVPAKCPNNHHRFLSNCYNNCPTIETKDNDGKDIIIQTGHVNFPVPMPGICSPEHDGNFPLFYPKLDLLPFYFPKAVPKVRSVAFSDKGENKGTVVT